MAVTTVAHILMWLQTCFISFHEVQRENSTEYESSKNKKI